MELRPQVYVPALGLVALVPVVAFALDRGEGVVWLSLVSVLVIAASAYYMFTPVGEEDTSPAP